MQDAVDAAVQFIGVGYLFPERRIDELIQQGREANHPRCDPLAAREQLHQAVECRCVLHQQDEVGAAL